MADSPRPGDVVGGRYRIEHAVGGGGFGAVYLATQLNMNRAVALKLLHPGLFSTEGAHERFVREAELAQQLKHPNTVRVYDFGRTDSGLPFIVWEYLEGQPLDALLAREGPQSPARVARIASQVLKALMEAHSLGIVHRDIKPSNLFVSHFSGEPDFVKVLDFGVAKIATQQGPEITTGALPVGTPSYMAPEQVRHEPVSPATDLYALGLVIAEMLVARPIVQGRALVDVFMQQASPLPVALPPEVVGGAFGNVILRATKKPALERYQSAAEMLADIERLGLSTPVSSVEHAPTLPAGNLPGLSTPSLATAMPAPPRRRSSALPWILLGVLLIVLPLGVAAAGAGYFLFGKDAPAATPPSDTAAVELEGIGGETIRRRVAPAGWTLPGEPVLNLEGTHQMNIFTLQKGDRYATVTIYDFVDVLEAETHVATLTTKPDIAAVRDHDLILAVEVRADGAEAKKLLALVTQKK